MLTNVKKYTLLRNDQENHYSLGKMPSHRSHTI
uniref:Uncharacterized protein n=1 Tax=Anguilla anguilla TaxID=7936 RepID=A0A0E9VII4_ANGAN